MSDIYRVSGLSLGTGRSGRTKVKVENDRGWLRIRFTYGGKRRCFAIGLPDTKPNRLGTERLAKQIEADIASGNFDDSLKKYKPVRGGINQSSPLVGDAIMAYLATRPELSKPSKDRYLTIARAISQLFPKTSIRAFDEAAVKKYLKSIENKSPATRKHYLTALQTVWRWASSQWGNNAELWHSHLKKIKLPPVQKQKPFSEVEITAILQALSNDPKDICYTPFVEFVFRTGLRLGEAAGLKWKHLSSDFSQAWIGESFSRGIQKESKTGKARMVALSPECSELLTTLRGQIKSKNVSELPIFTTIQGCQILTDTFLKRVWKPLLTRLEIDYRTPYTMRHTAISHAIASGDNPLLIAEQTGHDPQMLFKHYASSLTRKPLSVNF